VPRLLRGSHHDDASQHRQYNQCEYRVARQSVIVASLALAVHSPSGPLLLRRTTYTDAVGVPLHNLLIYQPIRVTRGAMSYLTSHPARAKRPNPRQLHRFYHGNMSVTNAYTLISVD
jgi:hypothetical protein